MGTSNIFHVCRIQQEGGEGVGGKVPQAYLSMLDAAHIAREVSHSLDHPFCSRLK